LLGWRRESPWCGHVRRRRTHHPIATDFALAKRFRGTEQRFVKLWIESYNGVSHANLDAPNTRLTPVDFGKVGTRSGGRIMQASLRLVF
jgi:hypothetical protein